MTEHLLTEKQGHVAHLFLNNPTKRNAINLEMWQGLGEVFSGFAKDPDVRVVVVSGSGDKAFSAGADISEFGEKRSTPEDRKIYENAVQGAFQAMRALPKVSIAMIDGVCIGGGAEVAMECDILLASDRSRFGITPAKLGIGYVLADIERLVGQLGAKAALEILATGKLYSAEEALALGWVRSVVAADDLEDEVNKLAQTISNNAPLSVKASKLIIQESLKPKRDRDTDLCAQLVEDCYLSDDCREGQAAFREKRNPVFAGR